jgi:hypothetical protein
MGLPSAAGGGAGSGSGSVDSSTPDPATVELGRAMQASAAYGQNIAHPVNSMWNPLNQDHTPQAATNQVLPAAYDAQGGGSAAQSQGGFGAEYSLAEIAAAAFKGRKRAVEASEKSRDEPTATDKETDSEDDTSSSEGISEGVGSGTLDATNDDTSDASDTTETVDSSGASHPSSTSDADADAADSIHDSDSSDAADDGDGYGSVETTTASASVANINAAKTVPVTNTDNSYATATTPPPNSPDQHESGILATRGQPVANPNILAGVSVVQHPALDGMTQGAHENPFKTFSPDAASFATNPLAYHPDAQVQHPSRVGAAAVAQTSSPPVAFGNYAGGNVAYNPAVATTIGAQRAHNYLIRSAFAPRQGEQAPYPAVPWHASPSVLHSAAGASAGFHPEPLADPWSGDAVVPTTLLEEKTHSNANQGTATSQTPPTITSFISTPQQVLRQRTQASQTSSSLASSLLPASLKPASLLEQTATAQVTRGSVPGSADGASAPPAGSGATYDGNYVKQWPPPPGASPANIIMPLGVAPVVPPPAPPTVGMAPPPPPASHVLDTPDVLPQPTPPVMATDARWGTKMFPTQSDAAGPSVPSLDARTSSDLPSEEFQNSPLMTPLGRENTIDGGTN